MKLLACTGRRSVTAAALGGAALLSPFASLAQQSTGPPRVGVLWIAPQAVVAPFHDAFRQGLRELGHVEGRTIVIVARFADGNVSLLPGLAQDW